MSLIKNIRTLSFFLEPGRNQLDFTYNTFSIPQRWQELIRDLRDAASRIAGKQQPSTALLNQLLIALFPQLISVQWHLSADKVWLFSREIIDPVHLKMVFSAWLKFEYERMKLKFPNELSNEIFEISLDWREENKNLIANTCNKWNTADVGNESFSLLPELIGDFISQPGFTIDFKSKVLSFRRAPNPSGSGGCELISWSPEEFNGHAYSVILNFTLQTIPYQSYPVVHLNMGIRRWVSANDAKFGYGKHHSVYLLTSFPGSDLKIHSQRFQITKTSWKLVNNKWVPVWENLLPGLFTQIYPNQTLPTPEEIRLHPLNYIDVPGLNAAIPFQNTMPAWQHKAAPGLTLADRRNLSEQIAPKLFETFGLIYTEAPEKVGGFILQKVKNTFFSSKKLSDIEKKENNLNRRKIVAQTVGKSVRLEIWYQTEMIRNALFEGVAQNLGFEIPRTYDLWEGHLFNSDELSVQIQFYELGPLADELDCTENTNKEKESAIRRRADLVVSTIDPQVSDLNDIKPIIAAFIELPGADYYKFKEFKDPKTALRAGFARTSRITQFITPKEEEIGHRAKMAALDLLRQFGVQSGHPLQTQKLFGKTVDYAAFWLYKPREDRQYFVPMFLHMCGKTGRINATALGFGGFLSYPEFLLTLGIPGKMKILDYKDKGKIPGIIKDWLKEVCADSDLMLLVSAQNARLNWSWLKNPEIAIDKVCFDNDQEIDISNWKGLRIIRVRESENGETPGFYAYKESENNELKDEKVVSFTEGVFKVNDRVFYSVGRKPKQLKKLIRMASKADNPELYAWNPRIIELTAACLQPDDDPRHWAMLAHRLRDYAIQTDENLSLPLPLHLLKTAKEYSEVGLLLCT
jgi:hypothetical protein